jgi:uncharacterized membrane protein YhaH (DUF805 family)
MSWYLQAMKKYADFGGRARRKEYWMYVLFNGIIGFALTALLLIEVAARGPGIFSVILLYLYFFGQIIPSLAVSTRRLHDTDRSGWYNLIVLVPLFGNIVLIFFLCQDSAPGANRFGANPKVRFANSRYANSRYDMD